MESQRLALIFDWSNKSLICSVCGETRSVKYQNENQEPICNLCALRQIGGEELVQKGKKQAIGIGLHVKIVNGDCYHGAFGYVIDEFFDMALEPVYMVKFDEPLIGKGMFLQSALEVVNA